jgi:hypothetical protein
VPAIQLPRSSVGPVISPNYNAHVQQGTQIALCVQIPGYKGTYQIGYATQLTESDSFGSQGFYGLGYIGPFEIQPLQFTGNLTLVGGRLYTVGWIGELFGPAEQILVSGALNVVVYNLVTGKADITFVGFVADSYSVQYQSNAYTIQTLTGQYRTVLLGQNSKFNPPQFSLSA